MTAQHHFPTASSSNHILKSITIHYPLRSLIWHVQIDEKGKEEARIEKSTDFMTFSDSRNRDILETHPSVSLSFSKKEEVSVRHHFMQPSVCFKIRVFWVALSLGSIRAHGFFTALFMSKTDSGVHYSIYSSYLENGLESHAVCLFKKSILEYLFFNKTVHLKRVRERFRVICSQTRDSGWGGRMDKVMLLSVLSKDEILCVRLWWNAKWDTMQATRGQGHRMDHSYFFSKSQERMIY